MNGSYTGKWVGPWYPGVQTWQDQVHFPPAAMRTLRPTQVQESSNRGLSLSLNTSVQYGVRNSVYNLSLKYTELHWKRNSARSRYGLKAPAIRKDPVLGVSAPWIHPFHVG